MDLALAIHTFNDEKGGKEIFTWNLVKNLLNRGHKVTIIGNQIKPMERQNFDSIQVTRFGKALGLHRWTFSRSVRSVLSEINYDLLYTNGKIGYGDVVRIGGLPLKQHLKVLENQKKSYLSKYFFRVRKKLSISKNMALHMEKKTFSPGNYGRIIVASNYIKEELLEGYPSVGSKDIDVIYNGYEPEKFNLDVRKRHRQEIRNHLSISSDTRLYIFVGNNFQLKGLYDFLPLLKCYQNSHLLVVGRGDPISIDEETDRRIHWIGEVNDVSPYYAASDALIFPTHSDGFGLVVLEALAMGLYVVVSGNAGSSELIREEWQGKVFEDLNSSLLSELGPNLLHNDELIKQRAEYAKSFDWDSVTESYLSVFNEIVNSKPSS